MGIREAVEKMFDIAVSIEGLKEKVHAIYELTEGWTEEELVMAIGYCDLLIEDYEERLEEEKNG